MCVLTFQGCKDKFTGRILTLLKCIHVDIIIKVCQLLPQWCVCIDVYGHTRLCVLYLPKCHSPR